MGLYFLSVATPLCLADATMLNFNSELVQMEASALADSVPKLTLRIAHKEASFAISVLALHYQYLKGRVVIYLLAFKVIKELKGSQIHQLPLTERTHCHKNCLVFNPLRFTRLIAPELVAFKNWIAVAIQQHLILQLYHKLVPLLL